MLKQYIPKTSILLAAVVSMFSLGVNATPISNSVKENSIKVDANLDDWANVASLGYDANTLADVNAQADFVEGWMANDSKSLYLAYRNNGDISASAWWSWQVYIDTDESESTGFTSLGSVGAEYLIQGEDLYKYTGTGNDWSWQYVSGTTSARNGAIAEFKIPRSSLGNADQFHAVFKARNFAFTGKYAASGVDTYPRSFAPLSLHDDLLHRQPSMWQEAFGTIAMGLSKEASAGTSELQMNSAYPLLANQLITYLSTDGEYYTAHIDTVNGKAVTLKSPLQASIGAGQKIWNFYEDGSHPNLYGYRAIADFAIRKIGKSKLNNGRHVLLGDSWFESPGVSERLAARLSNTNILNEGVGGNTSTQMLNRFDSDVKSHKPDFVWVMAGTNDFHMKVPTATYLSNIQTILAKISRIGAEAVVFNASVGQLYFGNDEIKQLSHSYVTALAGIVRGRIAYKFGATVQPPLAAEVSNLKSIKIDGALSDWDGLQSFGADGDDINEVGAKADFLEAWMAHDASNIYVAYRNHGDIDQSTWWPWQIYLDTDSDESSGFKVGNNVGANFIIQGQGLYRYIGTGSDWAWQYVATANHKINGGIVELALPRSAIDNAASLTAMMKARNGIFTGNYSQSGEDSYPNVGSGHFKYKLSGDSATAPLSNQVSDSSIKLDGKLSDWSATTSFGRDANDITDAASQADWLEAWAAHDNENLYFAYKNDGPINSLSWQWQVYIDADNNPLTGYSASSNLGADFILEGSNLRRYTGTGYDWLWDSPVVADSSTDGSIAEIAIPRSALGGLTNFRLLLKASNLSSTGNVDPSGLDAFPDAATNSSGYFSYSMR